MTPNPIKPADLWFIDADGERWTLQDFDKTDYLIDVQGAFMVVHIGKMAADHCFDISDTYSLHFSASHGDDR